MSQIFGSATAVYMLAHEVAVETGCSRAEATTAVVGAFNEKYSPYGPHAVTVLQGIDCLEQVKGSALAKIRPRIQMDPLLRGAL